MSTLVYAGARGGKSTFLAGLYEHLLETVQYSVACSVTRADSYAADVFERLARGQYPSSHRYTHLVELSVSEGRTVPEKTLGCIEGPGVHGQGTRCPIHPAAIDEQAVGRAYEDEVKPRIAKGRTLSPEDAELALKYHYLESDAVLFLLNLHSVLSRDVELPYDRSTITAVAEEKEVAVVVTATDLLDYDPTESGGLLSRLLSRSPTDTDLLDTLGTKLSHADHDVRRIAAAAEGASFDLFGVCVPCREPPASETPAAADGSIETRGFERVVKWL